MNGKWKHAPKTKTSNKKQQKSIFHSHFHSIAPILELWKVVEIKSNEKPERATTGNEKAMKSSKKVRRATKSNNRHRSWKNQNRQEKAKTSNERHSNWKLGSCKEVSLHLKFCCCGKENQNDCLSLKKRKVYRLSKSVFKNNLKQYSLTVNACGIIF